jgi:hypothetical protein
MEEQRKRFDWLPEFTSWWQYDRIMEERERWKAIRGIWRGNSSLPDVTQAAYTGSSKGVDAEHKHSPI